MAPIKSNNPYASYFDFFSKSGLDAVSSAPVPEGITATGGIISDYESGGKKYRSHVFTSAGTFSVSDLGNIASTIDYLVIGGGGGGGSLGGGGGAGLLRYKEDQPISTGPYAITIGGGGAGSAAHPTGTNYGFDGTSTVLSLPSAVTSPGGGGGGGEGQRGRAGGSAGGDGNNAPTSSNDAPGDSGHPGSADVESPANGWGNNGGRVADYPDAYSGGGGGGAGGVGTNGIKGGGAGQPGGNGAPYTVVNGSAVTYAGGGGGGGYGGAAGNGGPGGGGDGGGPVPYNGTDGTYSTGSGGGGGGYPAYGAGGSGGSGIVVVRYEIGSSVSAKASGGAISFYGGKTIHAFTSTGTFTAPATFNETVEYVVVGGGGAGGGPSVPGNSYYGGGGGAGAYRKGTTPISTPQTINVQIGAGGAKNSFLPAAGSPSYFGSPITSPGGGYGATWQDPGGQPTVGGGPGASSGGSSYGGSVASNTGTSFTASPKDATANTPTNGWGHGGGTGHPTGDSGGGGGAGGAGQNAADSAAGDGGLGMQLPTTFRDPASTVGAPGPTNTSSHNPGWTNVDDSGKYWVAGGGGGSAYGPDSGHTSGVGGVGSPPVGSSPFAGAGNGSRLMAGGTAALQNTGSGGGGMERATPNPSPQPDAGNGGSGLVLIAYPT